MKHRLLPFAVLFFLPFAVVQVYAQSLDDLRSQHKTLAGQESRLKSLLDDLNKRGKAALPVTLPPAPAVVDRPDVPDPIPAQMRKNFVSRRNAVLFRFDASRWIWSSAAGAILPGGDPQEFAGDLTSICHGTNQLPRSYKVVVEQKNRSLRAEPASDDVWNSVLRLQNHALYLKIMALRTQIDDLSVHLTAK